MKNSIKDFVWAFIMVFGSFIFAGQYIPHISEIAQKGFYWTGMAVIGVGALTWLYTIVKGTREAQNEEN